MGDRTMAIVTGYLPGIDVLPRWVQRLGLNRRVAFVLDSSRPGKVDTSFDAELYAALVDAAREVFRADRIASVSATGETLKEFRAASDLMREYEPLPEVDRDPLEQALLLRGETIVAAIGSEPWANAGGPQPYHDSFTVPIYSQDDAAAELEAAARSTCARLGADITEVVHGGPTPLPPGILRRLVTRFFW
jgi:hypothetical protein